MEVSASALFYEIAGRRLLIRSDPPLSDRPSWRAFSATFSEAAPPDFTYRIHAVSPLPSGCEGSAVRYFDAVKNRDYAVTIEQGDAMEVYLDAASLPCPLTVEHLYPQLALPHILLRSGAMLLHASYILTERGAILFTAPSGTGKTTQAELWRRHRGARIVNGDRAVLGFQNGEPSAFGFPLSGTSADCRNLTAPVRAVVRLSQAAENNVRRLNVRESIRVLLNGTYLPPEYRSDLPIAFDAAAALAECIPVYSLACLPNVTAIEALENALRETEGAASCP